MRKERDPGASRGDGGFQDLVWAAWIAALGWGADPVLHDYDRSRKEVS